MQPTISNDCLKLSIHGQVGPQLVSKLLFQVSAIEPHKNVVSPPEQGVLKEKRRRR